MRPIDDGTELHGAREGQARGGHQLLELQLDQPDRQQRARGETAFLVAGGGERQQQEAAMPGAQGKNVTTPASRSYIAPAIRIVPLASRSASTGLRLRISAIVSSTFLRATRSTNA